MLFLHHATRASRWLNILMLTLLSLCLLGGLGLQYSDGLRLPPLFELQRLGAVMAGVGIMLNFRLGPSPLHYVMVLAGALGMLLAGGWVLLQPGAAVAVLAGWRAETWMCLLALALMLFGMLMLVGDRKWGDNALKKPLALPAKIVIGLFVLTALALTVNTALQRPNPALSTVR